MFCAIFVLLLITGSVRSQHPGIETQIFVPEEMPIKLEVILDNSDPAIPKYSIKQTISDDVQLVRIVVIKIGQDGRIKQGDGSVVRLTNKRLGKPLIVPLEGTDKGKVLVIAERLVTTSGQWVIDNTEQKVPIEAVVERGVKALPKGRFIKND